MWSLGLVLIFRKRCDTYLRIKTVRPWAWSPEFWGVQGEGEGQWEEMGRGARTVSFRLFSSCWERNENDAECNWSCWTELARPCLNLCERKAVVFSLPEHSHPNGARGPLAAVEGLQNLCAFSQLFSADVTPWCCPLACWLHPGLASAFSAGLLFYWIIVDVNTGLMKATLSKVLMISPFLLLAVCAYIHPADLADVGCDIFCNPTCLVSPFTNYRASLDQRWVFLGKVGEVLSLSRIYQGCVIAELFSNY